jgi:benzoyl-CoA reductase/2-hydroxyglutaryl-CoA dehydratase subunit BcrC/BadD/HgdB
VIDSLLNPGLDALTRAYRERDRAALEWKARGGQVAGCLGADVPEEFLIAAGILPVHLCGNPLLPGDAADRYIERAFDPHIRSQFARIVVEGAYRYLDHLIASSSSDALVRVFYYLRALRQCEPDLPIPDLYCFDLVHSRFRTSALYNHDRARAFRRVVGDWRGELIPDESLRQAIDLCNEKRGLLRQLAELRVCDPPRVSGVEALQITGASMFLARAEHSCYLRTFLDAARERPALPGVPVFVTGSAQDHARFYELVESCGAVIVGEDHDWGNRHFEGAVDSSAADLTAAIVDRYHMRSPAAGRASISARVKALVEQACTARAQAVIALIYQKDDAPSWDFPEQRRALQAAHIPVLLLDNQPYPMGDAGELRGRVLQFIAACRGVAL